MSRESDDKIVDDFGVKKYSNDVVEQLSNNTLSWLFKQS